MLRNRVGITYFVLALTLFNAPARTSAQTLLEYTPPPMFGDNATEPVQTLAGPKKTAPKIVKQKVVEPVTTITKTPIPRPTITKQTEDKNRDTANIPVAKPIIPTKLVESEAGPSMPSSPKASIHKSSILIEDPSFNTGAEMTRNLDAFEDSHSPQQTTPRKNPVLPHKKEEKLVSTEYVEPSAKDLFSALNNQNKKDIKEENKAPKNDTESYNSSETKTSLLFKKQGMDLSSSHIEVLAQKVLQRFILLNEQYGKSARIQVVAYAQTDEEPRSGISGAKRLSLARALSVQGWLVDNGIASTQIDVKAKGDETENDQKDRVDLYLIYPQD